MRKTIINMAAWGGLGSLFAAMGFPLTTMEFWIGVLLVAIIYLNAVLK